MNEIPTRPGRRHTIAGLLAAVGLLAVLLPALANGSGAAAAPATVYIVHGIPSVGNVDVCANGTTTLAAGVAFKGVAKVSVDAGTYDLTVKAADANPCTGATLITLNGATVPAGANLSVVAALTGGSPRLDVFENDVTEVASGSGRVAVYHAADAPNVDILVNGQPGLTDLAQGKVAGAELPAASYDFTVTPAGDDSTTVLDLPGTPVAAGHLLQVFAVGAVGNDLAEANPFQVITNAVPLATTPASSTSTVAPTTTMMVPPAPVAASPGLTG